MSRVAALALVVPILLAVFATGAARRGSGIGVGACTILFAAFTLLTGFSIGRAYVPAAGLLLAAMLVGELGRANGPDARDRDPR